MSSIPARKLLDRQPDITRFSLFGSPVKSRDISAEGGAWRSMAAVVLTLSRRRAFQALGNGVVRLLSPRCFQGQ